MHPETVGQFNLHRNDNITGLISLWQRYSGPNERMLSEAEFFSKADHKEIVKLWKRKYGREIALGQCSMRVLINHVNIEE